MDDKIEIHIDLSSEEEEYLQEHNGCIESALREIVEKEDPSPKGENVKWQINGLLVPSVRGIVNSSLHAQRQRSFQNEASECLR